MDIGSTCEQDPVGLGKSWNEIKGSQFCCIDPMDRGWFFGCNGVEVVLISVAFPKSWGNNDQWVWASFVLCTVAFLWRFTTSQNEHWSNSWPKKSSIHCSEKIFYLHEDPMPTSCLENGGRKTRSGVGVFCWSEDILFLHPLKMVYYLEWFKITCLRDVTYSIPFRILNWQTSILKCLPFWFSTIRNEDWTQSQ